MLVAAGRLSYWQGWAYGISNFLLIIIDYLVIRSRPGLLEERLSSLGVGTEKKARGRGEETKWWDKVYYAVTTPLFFIAILFAAVDVGRFSWSPPLPTWAYFAAWAAYLLGQGIHFWAKGTNTWFATVVRIQTDRGQQVCDKGPYRFVRHPGYVGGILLTLTTPLLLGSLWAVIPQAIAAACLIVRTYLEDATLRAELPGYAEYAKKVKHRLLPLG